jgi:hypothetical protein
MFVLLIESKIGNLISQSQRQRQRQRDRHRDTEIQIQTLALLTAKVHTAESFSCSLHAAG